MGKLKHIIAREYLTRIRKKAFIVMTFLGPVLFAAIMIVPIWVSALEDSDEKTIGVIEFDIHGSQVPDTLLQLEKVFKNKEKLKFDYLDGMSMGQAKALVEEGAYYGILAIRHNVLLSGEPVVELFAQKQPSMGIELHITNSIEEYIKYMKLVKYGYPAKEIHLLETNARVITRVAEDGDFREQGSVWVKRGIGYASGFLIYMFIFFFGAQVMRGVVEEKTNRIIEVIITSVKPFQLMLGKIVGIGLVGLSQFLVWVVLTFLIIIGAESVLSEKQFKDIQTQQQTMDLFDSPSSNQLMVNPEKSIDEMNVAFIRSKLNEIPFGKIIAMFLFYFIGGYLLYSAMFAAIGAAVDSETDTQQFMLPVTIPLVISLVVMMNAISNPEGQVAYWFSIIPFTSPVVMMARSGFNPPPGDIFLSGGLLILTFIGMTWFSGKIYRTGILMYGKKVNYKELWKWMRYK